MIPRYEPTYSFADLNASLIQAFRSDRTSLLESMLQEFFHVKHVFLLNGGRASLFVILKILNKPGKVLLPAYTCRSVPESIVAAGYTPYFLDPDLETLNISAESYEKAMSEDVTALFACSLFGIPYDVRPIKELTSKKGILLVEDAATAMGGRVDGRFVGTIGDVGVISFQDTKVLSGKTGGVIITDNDELAQKISKFLSQAPIPKITWKLYLSASFSRFSTMHWFYPITRAIYALLFGEAMYEIVPPMKKFPKNYYTRCSPFSVELIHTQWERVEQIIKRRKWIGESYYKSLKNNPAFQIPVIPAEIEPVWIQYPMLVKDKRDFYKYMQRHNIDITWSHRYTVAEEYPQEGCPNAKMIAQSILSLPCYPGLSDAELQKVCQIASEYKTG